MCYKGVETFAIRVTEANAPGCIASVYHYLYYYTCCISMVTFIEVLVQVDCQLTDINEYHYYKKLLPLTSNAL